MVDLPVNSVVDGIQFHSEARRQNRRCQTNGQTQTCVSPHRTPAEGEPLSPGEERGCAPLTA